MATGKRPAPKLSTVPADAGARDAAAAAARAELAESSPAPLAPPPEVVPPEPVKPPIARHIYVARVRRTARGLADVGLMLMQRLVPDLQPSDRQVDAAVQDIAEEVTDMLHPGAAGWWFAGSMLGLLGTAVTSAMRADKADMPRLVEPAPVERP